MTQKTIIKTLDKKYQRILEAGKNDPGSGSIVATTDALGRTAAEAAGHVDEEHEAAEAETAADGQERQDPGGTSDNDGGLNEADGDGAEDAADQVGDEVEGDTQLEVALVVLGLSQARVEARHQQVDQEGETLEGVKDTRRDEDAVHPKGGGLAGRGIMLQRQATADHLRHAGKERRTQHQRQEHVIPSLARAAPADQLRAEQKHLASSGTDFHHRLIREGRGTGDHRYSTTGNR